MKNVTFKTMFVAIALMLIAFVGQAQPGNPCAPGLIGRTTVSIDVPDYFTVGDVVNFNSYIVKASTSPCHSPNMISYYTQIGTDAPVLLGTASEVNDVVTLSWGPPTGTDPDDDVKIWATGGTRNQVPQYVDIVE